jgi:hypothetical protein
MEMTTNDFCSRSSGLEICFGSAVLVNHLLEFFWHSGREKPWNILSEYHGKEKSMIEQALRINAFWLH